MTSNPEIAIVPEGLPPEERYAALCKQLSEARTRRGVLRSSIPEGMSREEVVGELNSLEREIPDLEVAVKSTQREILEAKEFPGYIIVGDTILVLSQFENENGRHLKVEKVIEGSVSDDRLVNIRPGMTAYKADLSNAPSFIKEAVDTNVFLKDEKGYDFSQRYGDMPDTDSKEDVGEALPEAA